MPEIVCLYFAVAGTNRPGGSAGDERQNTAVGPEGVDSRRKLQALSACAARGGQGV